MGNALLLGARHGMTADKGRVGAEDVPRLFHNGCLYRGHVGHERAGVEVWGNPLQEPEGRRERRSQHDQVGVRDGGGRVGRFGVDGAAGLGLVQHLRPVVADDVAVVAPLTPSEAQRPPD